jgi:hypothetical protein
VVFVSDLRHFLDVPEDAPGPARRMAEHLTLIVRAATAGDGGQPWVSALPCRRRPGRRPCPGHLTLFRSDMPPSIQWWCSDCGDEGVISGWDASPFDLRARRPELVRIPTVRAVIPAEVAATLRSLLLVDVSGERLVFRARLVEEGIVLAGDEEGLEELLDSIAAEANHEEDGRRRKRLDRAFEVLKDVLEREG